MSALGQDLSSERARTTELQEVLEQSQQGLAKLQSEYYGKESELSSLRQDLKVGGRPCKHRNILTRTGIHIQLYFNGGRSGSVGVRQELSLCEKKNRCVRGKYV